MIDESSLPKSDFFITLDKQPDLAKTASLFGKIVGPTIHNLVEAEEVPLEEDFKPRIGVSISAIDVVINPFEDLVLQSKKKETEPVASQPVQLPSFRKKQKFKLAEDDGDIQSFSKTPLVVANPDLKPKKAKEDEPSLSKQEQPINSNPFESAKRVKESSSGVSGSTPQEESEVPCPKQSESLKKFEALKSEIKKLTNPESSDQVTSSGKLRAEITSKISNREIQKPNSKSARFQRAARVSKRNQKQNGARRRQNRLVGDQTRLLG